MVTRQVILKPLNFLKSFSRWMRVISLGDYFKMRAWLRDCPDHNLAISVHKHPVIIRPHTSDFLVFAYTFHNRTDRIPGKLPRRPTILDLGCNVGYTLIDFSHQYPNACLVGVEMDTENYQMAKKNTEKIDCKLLNVAVHASNNGHIRYGGRGETNSFHIARDMELKEFITMPCMTINSIVDKYNLSHLDYVKMDIEGEEIPIFTDESSNLSWLAFTSLIRVEVHVHQKYLKSLAAVLKDYKFDVSRDSNHKSALIAVKKN